MIPVYLARLSASDSSSPPASLTPVRSLLLSLPLSPLRPAAALFLLTLAAMQAARMGEAVRSKDMSSGRTMSSSSDLLGLLANESFGSGAMEIILFGV